MIFGQDGPIDEVASGDQAVAIGLRAPDKPIGNFLFAGPTGVGKTELARQLARIMGIEFIRFDMSEHMEKHAVSRLIGAPPGYVGYEEGGLLIDAIRKSPHAVLLLDEIEKAHPDMFSDPAAGDGPRHADRFARAQGRLPSRHPDHDDQRRRRDLSDRRLWGSPNTGRADRRAARSSGRSRRSSATVSTPSSLRRARDHGDREGRGQADRRGAWHGRAKKVTIELDPAARAWLARRGSTAPSARGRWRA